jgi:poly-gamma-glutamate capsule biosynthesis protein CapA/YwtB (metallophosphatase superfamily)
MGLTLALGGDAILTRRISQCGSPDAQAILDLFRKSDLGIVNCEMLLHDFDGPELYPSAEAGWTYMRAPRFVAQELAAIGIKLVGTANNHFLDYAVGGLLSTHRALAAAGIELAGSGRDLAQARAPAFYDAPDHRVSLVSMTTSATRASRAAPPHDGIPGRPGVNPLGWHYCGDAETIAQAVAVAVKFGSWVAKVSDREWQINPPGLHHTVQRYFVTDTPGAGMVLDEDDEAANLRSIRTARQNSDIVIAHIHTHEWDQEAGSAAVPPKFLPPFARRAIDAGADVVLSQGSHAPLRGIEIYNGKPIFYDPGDLFAMSSLVTRFPAEFYTRHDVHRLEDVLPADGVAARQKYFKDFMVNPVGGYQNGRGRLGVVPIIKFEGRKAVQLELHPFTHAHTSVAHFGMPMRAEGDTARRILNHLSDLSQPFGCRISIDNSVGQVDLT